MKTQRKSPLNAALKGFVRPKLKSLLLHSFKGGGLTVWLVMALFDAAWHVFIRPLIRKEQRLLAMRRSAERIKGSARGIVKAKSLSELGAAYKQFYSRRDNV